MCLKPLHYFRILVAIKWLNDANRSGDLVGHVSVVSSVCPAVGLYLIHEDPACVRLNTQEPHRLISLLGNESVFT